MQTDPVDVISRGPDANQVIFKLLIYYSLSKPHRDERIRTN
jgi:hypothetical protein